jgi:putative transposase
VFSYKYRVEPNQTQQAALDAMLGDFCDLYNAGLQQRIEAYRRRGISVAFKMQSAELRAVRTECPNLNRWSVTAEQQVLRRLDKAFQAFFGRIKRGETPGFPRFRAKARYHTAEFRVGDGLTLRKSGRIGIVGVGGEIKVRWHRALPAKPASALLTRQCGKWCVIFHVEVETANTANSKTVGIDLGLTSLIALSTGETEPRPGFTKRAAKGLRKRSRALARCKKGSKQRVKIKALKAKYENHIANKRRDYLHKLSRNLVNRFGRIAVEDLNIKGLAGGMLAKHVNDASWAQLVSMLDYEAAKAGGECIKVDPRGTSQECPECGQIAVKTLNERRHRCDCGADLDRDVAAAMVVHHRAFGFRAWNRPGAAKPAQWCGLTQKPSPSGDGSSRTRGLRGIVGRGGSIGS